MEENCDERESVSRGVLAATSTLQMLLKSNSLNGLIESPLKLDNQAQNQAVASLITYLHIGSPSLSHSLFPFLLFPVTEILIKIIAHQPLTQTLLLILPKLRQYTQMVSEKTWGLVVMKSSGRLLVPGPACKKLRRHKPILLSEKLSKLKNQQSFLDLLVICGHRMNCCPLNQRDRLVNTENYNLLEQNLGENQVLCQENLNYN